MMALSFSATQVVAGEQTVRDTLKKIIPNSETAKVKESSIKGLYEVTQGLQVMYLTGDGKYALTGNMIDLNSGQNLTQLSQEKARKKLFDEIPVSSTIVYPAKGKVKRIIDIFSDIDCPYCRKMHMEIPTLNAAGIEVRYLAFPRSGVNTPSYVKAVSVWCADNPAKAMDEAMLTGKVSAKTCKNPIIEHMDLAQKFGVNGTPNIITDQGELFPGYLPAPKLIQALGL